MSEPSKSTKLPFKRLRRRPPELMEGMINLEEDQWAYDPELEVDETQSTPLGRLDTLPLELLHEILSMLDFKTIMNVSETCTRGLTIVRSLPAYRDLIEHAPQVLGALGWTGLIVWHSAATLHRTLQTSACVSCGEFGAFLFLPTCERCCNQCLITNPALWVISPQTAKIAFGTTNAQLKRSPVLRSLPSTYYMPREVMRYSPEYHWMDLAISRKQRLRLVSVKAAKILALESIADEEALKEEFRKHRDYGNFSRDFIRILLEAPLQGPCCAVSERVDGYGRDPKDKHCFMASMPFPHVTADGKRDAGHWCKGCQFALDEYYFTRRDTTAPNWPRNSPPAWIAQNIPIPQGLAAERHLERLTRIGRSRKEFTEHLKDCAGAKQLTAVRKEKGLRGAKQ